jgi:hypothetical protein
MLWKFIMGNVYNYIRVFEILEVVPEDSWGLETKQGEESL